MEYLLLVLIGIPACLLGAVMLLLITGVIRDPSGAGLVAANYRTSWLQRRG